MQHTCLALSLLASLLEFRWQKVSNAVSIPSTRSIQLPISDQQQHNNKGRDTDVHADYVTRQITCWEQRARTEHVLLVGVHVHVTVKICHTCGEHIPTTFV